MISLKRRKNGDITEDDLRSQTDDVQKATDNSIKDIDQLLLQRKRYYVSIGILLSQTHSY